MNDFENIPRVDPHEFNKVRVRTMKDVSRRANKCRCEPEVLVVDDNDFNIFPVKLMLKELYNIDIHSASNGQIAVDMFKERWSNKCKCKNRVFRLIIMDISMPVMDGIKASNLILKLQNAQRYDEELTHIVALTAHTNKEYITKCKAVGMKDVYNKPLIQDDLKLIMARHYFRQ